MNTMKRFLMIVAIAMFLSVSASASVGVCTATGAAAISKSCAVLSDIRIIAVTIKFSAAPTTSENLTITLNSGTGAAYDVVLYSFDPSALATTTHVWIPDDQGISMVTGDSLDIAFTNTDTRTYGVVVYYEILP